VWESQPLRGSMIGAVVCGKSHRSSVRLLAASAGSAWSFVFNDRSRFFCCW
jgi:hypothetical protein